MRFAFEFFLNFFCQRINYLDFGHSLFTFLSNSSKDIYLSDGIKNCLMCSFTAKSYILEIILSYDSPFRPNEAIFSFTTLLTLIVLVIYYVYIVYFIYFSLIS